MSSYVDNYEQTEIVVAFHLFLKFSDYSFYDSLLSSHHQTTNHLTNAILSLASPYSSLDGSTVVLLSIVTMTVFATLDTPFLSTTKTIQYLGMITPGSLGSWTLHWYPFSEARKLSTGARR
jgi:hypothetical protein